MMDYDFRLNNTIAEIEYADNYDKYADLFDKAIIMLKSYIGSGKEFSDDDRELLEKVYTVIVF